MISQSKTYKIAIVAYNLQAGGLANVIINVYKILNSINSVDVQLILLDNDGNHEFSGQIIDFGYNSSRKLSFIQKIRKYKRFNSYLKKNNFNFIIDLRYRLNPLTELLITRLIYGNSKVIYNVHSSKVETYLLKQKWLTELLYGKSHKIVCGAKGNEDIVLEKYNLKNATTIYNPLDIATIVKMSEENCNLQCEYIVAVGRVEPLKQFDKLIEAYTKSVLPSKNIKLVIVGNGSQLEYCENLVTKLNLEQEVIFTGFTSNPYKYMSKAKFLVLCSQYEGFGLVLAEALACKTPVLSFDLLTGPNEIINHEENGLLVENQNFEALTQEMNRFIKDQKLYQKCKSNAFESIQKFSFENIRENWVNLMNLKD